MRRFLPFLLLALIPVAILAILSPDRLMSGANVDAGRYRSKPGSVIVAIVRDGCPHCAAFEEFAKEQEWDVEYREITDRGTTELFQKVQHRAPALQQGVPTIIIDGRVIQGYETHEKTGAMLRRLYDGCRAKQGGCTTLDAFLSGTEPVTVMSAAAGTCTDHCETDESKYIFDLWIIGSVNLLFLSLPTLSLLLGFLDGFNPCAMWVLVTLLTLLIGTRDQKKIWVVGGTFLFVSGAVYYLFIAAWLNVFLLIGLNVWIQKIIGLVALGGGGFYLYEAFGKDPHVCQVSDFKRRQRTIERMKEVLQKSAWPAVITGVAILAVSVNMIELVCTAGLPAIFTEILAFNRVPAVARYGYILLYILMYMLDDIIIFAVAVTTLHATGLTTKYRRLTLIIGGLLMYILGILLIFWPEALTFA